LLRTREKTALQESEEILGEVFFREHAAARSLANVTSVTADATSGNTAVNATTAATGANKEKDHLALH
jgi:hypothetical protein